MTGMVDFVLRRRVNSLPMEVESALRRLSRGQVLRCGALAEHLAAIQRVAGGGEQHRIAVNGNVDLVAVHGLRPPCFDLLAENDHRDVRFPSGLQFHRRHHTVLAGVVPFDSAAARQSDDEEGVSQSTALSHSSRFHLKFYLVVQAIRSLRASAGSASAPWGIGPASRQPSSLRHSARHSRSSSGTNSAGGAPIQVVPPR